MIVIGIDPGTFTGFAVWDTMEKSYVTIKTLKIHQALDIVSDYNIRNIVVPIFVRIEDARKWKGFGVRVKGKDQGAGSIKRDCSIWEDFCQDLKIPHEMVNLQSSLKKLSPDAFSKITGVTERTSEHARDAAMLIYQFKPRKEPHL